MKAAFGPLASGLAQSLLECGVGERLTTLGLSWHRMERAAESVLAADQLSSRETAALAYASGLSGRDTALLAFGVGPTVLERPVPQMLRFEQLNCAKQSWWTEPSSRVSDLGDLTTRRLIGALVGLELKDMAEEDPLTVPVDARYAAMAQLNLGEHWELLVGLKDQAWISELNQAHHAESQKFLHLATQEDLRDQEEDDDAYHLVPVPMVPAERAASYFGHGVTMVMAAGRDFTQMHVHMRREGLHVTVSNTNDRWMDGCRRLYQELTVQSLAEVGQELIRRIPAAKDWAVVSLKFPSHLPRVKVESHRNRTA